MLRHSVLSVEQSSNYSKDREDPLSGDLSEVFLASGTVVLRTSLNICERLSTSRACC